MSLFTIYYFITNSIFCYSDFWFSNDCL